MPLTIPTIDGRRYQDLVDEALARIPVHNPEWTNFNQSDPGVTLIQLFAFLAENLLYRANQIPERNRRRFLSLLGVPLQPAASARGIVTIANGRGPREVVTLNSGLELRAGAVPFRTTHSLDVLPVEAQAYYKRPLADPPAELLAHYRRLYASFRGQPPTDDLLLYETVPFPERETDAPGRVREAVDGSIWIALLARREDRLNVEDLRTTLAGKTLSLGIVPIIADAANRRLGPGTGSAVDTRPVIRYEIPRVPADRQLPNDPALRVPQYQALDARTVGDVDVLAEPGVVQLTLPAASDLAVWENLDPLEPGAGDFPPALDDAALDARVITWLRLRSSSALPAQLLWAGINAAMVEQRSRVFNEVLPLGTGEPDQQVTLSRTPVIPGSVVLRVDGEAWTEIEDLLTAGPEVPTPDLRRSPGAVAPAADRPHTVYVVDPESGIVRFGDGIRGGRPPTDAVMRADYDYGVGRHGNVGKDAIVTGPSLPVGFTVTNPVRSWGAADAETVAEGEKQIARYLQHRDRLVTVADFDTITRRTPGVDIGRVDVLPAFTPELPGNEPGDAPGAVTLLVIPKYDSRQPDAPEPDRLFLDTICRYLDPRRLVTTELFLRGPNYRPIWVSLGIDVVAGTTVPQVREDVRRAVLQYLSPLPPPDAPALDAPDVVLGMPAYAQRRKGWPLRKAVVDLELLAVASRVPGVLLVNRVLLAESTGGATSRIPMTGLELPRVLGISVAVGDPVDIDELRRGQRADAPPRGLVPVPIVPEEC